MHLATKKLLPVLSLIILSMFVHGQDFRWWDAKHDWNGIPPRSDLIVRSPAFMGPNALPVPCIQNGAIPGSFSFTLGGEGHFNTGDRTLGVWTNLYTPLFSDRVGLGVRWVPIEFYRMDTITRDLRRSMDFDGRGNNTTDIYFSTFISLVRDHRVWPDILVTLNLRTATGNRLSEARTTDSPGYYFDVSFGKDFILGPSGNYSIRPYLLAGFYVWQIRHNQLNQNDAFLFGAGVDAQLGPIGIKNVLGGYAGYIGDGDDPLVYRLQVSTRFPAKINYQLLFQQGINDYPFTTVRVGLRYTP